MFDDDSPCGAAFKYARWLRETGQWDAMHTFSAVIHPVVGQLAGRSRTRLSDLTTAIIARSIRDAARHGITPDMAMASWGGFKDFLAAAGLNLALPNLETPPHDEDTGPPATP